MGNAPFGTRLQAEFRQFTNTKMKDLGEKYQAFEVDQEAKGRFGYGLDRETFFSLIGLIGEVDLEDCPPEEKIEDEEDEEDPTTARSTGIN